jgi:hypothetical protein
MKLKEFGLVGRKSPKRDDLPSLIVIPHESIQYVSHINQMMNSPPKKRTMTTSKWGRGIPQQNSHTPSSHSQATFSNNPQNP